LRFLNFSLPFPPAKFQTLDLRLHFSTIPQSNAEIEFSPLLKYAAVAGLYINELMDDEIDLPKKLPAQPFSLKNTVFLVIIGVHSASIDQ
jgi:hypothetical protein